MKSARLFNTLYKLFLFGLLLSNFNAFSQKTNIWIVSYAETDDSTATNKDPGLNAAGQVRAVDLVKALKHEGIKAIYVMPQKASGQTAAPLAQKDKILPRISTDSVQGLVTKLLKNFQGSNVLIVAPYRTVITYIEAFGGRPPFESINKDDNDLLFSLTLNSNNDNPDLYISHYGKAHHSTEIPRQYLLDQFYPGYTPPMINH